jgi:hypothetical protein
MSAQTEAPAGRDGAASLTMLRFAYPERDRGVAPPQLFGGCQERRGGGRVEAGNGAVQRQRKLLFEQLELTLAAVLFARRPRALESTDLRSNRSARLPSGRISLDDAG